MSQRHWQGYCRRCGRPTLHLADIEDVPHVVYALFTLLSCGLVSLLWIAHSIVAASGTPDWRCSQCGTAYVAANSPDRSTGKVLRVMGLILIAAFFGLLLVAAKVGTLDNKMLAITSPAGVLGVLFLMIGLAVSWRQSHR